MALATMGAVLQLAREHLGDVDIVSTGEVFTDTKLLAKGQVAFRELNDLAIRYGLPECERFLYRYLPSWRGYVDLADNLEFSFDEPFAVHEMPILSRHKVASIAAISGSDDGRVTGDLKVTTDGTDTTTTFTEGGTAILYDVTTVNGLNGEWPVVGVVATVPIEIDINCPEAPGSPTLTYAYIVNGVREWSQTAAVDVLDYVSPIGGFRVASRKEYVWRGGRIQTPSSYQPRMFRATVFVNFPAPATVGDTIFFESAEQYLGARTAALAIMDEAAGPEDASIPFAVEIDMLARGQGRQSDGSGGFLADWLDKNRIRRRVPPIAAPVAARG